jgi:hypothetical protein
MKIRLLSEPLVTGALPHPPQLASTSTLINARLPFSAIFVQILTAILGR